MQHGAHIGPSLVIKGEVSAEEPLTISGRVNGSVAAPGHIVTIEAGAHVTAGVIASGIIVSGTVQGSLVAEERIALRAGADVEGDLRAPRLAVEDGEHVCGKAIVWGPQAVDLPRAS